MEEGERAITALHEAVAILKCPMKVARLMKDYGQDGRVDDEDFRPIFEELREVANEAAV